MLMTNIKSLLLKALIVTDIAVGDIGNNPKWKDELRIKLFYICYCILGHHKLFIKLKLEYT